MITKKRRFILILVSVGTGSLISLFILKQKLGTLNQADYISLLFNFFFAAVMVVGLAILLQRMNDKYDNEQKK
jgi:Na+-driven multidrug efflux pump